MTTNGFLPPPNKSGKTTVSLGPIERWALLAAFALVSGLGVKTYNKIEDVAAAVPKLDAKIDALKDRVPDRLAERLAVIESHNVRP